MTMKELKKMTMKELKKMKMKKNNIFNGIYNTGDILIKVVLSAIKSFIFALSQIVWVFAGVLIIGAAIVFLIKSGDIKTMTELPKGLGYVIDIFINYWQWFFGGIWIFDFIINFKDINKK